MVEFWAGRDIREAEDWDVRTWGGGWEAVVSAVGVHNHGDDGVEVGGGVA